MDDSETQTHIINLGKALVEELGLNPGVDTLARWMAHYIAEQIVVAENTTGNDKIIAEQRCFETILKVWEHRASLPHGRRPFESFEPIFRALERLDPENSVPLYYSQPRSSESDDLNQDTREVRQWLDLAEGVDQAARICLEYIFIQAALKATDEKTITWLVNTSDVARDRDLSVIRLLVREDPDNANIETAKREWKMKQQNLKLRIEKIDTVINFTQELRTAFTAELESMSQSQQPPTDKIDTDLD